MNLRIVGFSTFSFVLGVVLVASITPGVSVVQKGEAMNMQDDRAADRQAIRTHIECRMRGRPEHHCPRCESLQLTAPVYTFPCLKRGSQ